MSIGTIIVIGISLALQVLTLVLTAKAGDAASNLPSADRQTLGDMRVTEQREGIVVPIVYGYATITGSLIWWEAEKMNTGSNAMYYRYKCWQTICMGEISNVHHYNHIGTSWYSNRRTYDTLSIWMDEKPTFTDLKKLWPVHIPDLGDYYQEQPHAIVYNGNDNSLIGVHALTNKEYATRLKGVAHILIGIELERNGQYLKSPHALEPGVTQIPTFKFCVQRTVLNKYDKIIGIGSDGSNVAGVYYDLLTNNQYGGDINPSEIDDVSFDAAATYFRDEGFAINFVINSTQTLKEIILKIQEWTDSYLVKDINNKYAIKILKETDLPVTTIDIDDKQIEFTLRRKSWDDTYNCFTGSYIPVLRYYRREAFGIVAEAFKNDTVQTVTIKNEANIQLTGNERLKTIDLTCYANSWIASKRLTQIMKKESFPFANASLTTNMEYYNLRVGDVVTIDSNNLNVSAPFRVININYQKIDENKLTFDLIQMRELLTDVHYSNCSLSRGSDTRAQEPPFLENVTFPHFTAISNKLSRDFIDDSKSVVHWGTGQLRSGRLEYGIDYTVISHNRIKLDEAIFGDEIGFNANGLLNIDVFEDIISES